MACIEKSIRFFRKNQKLFLLIFLILAFESCKVNYSMSGASISPDVKTIAIRFFKKTAALGPVSLSQSFTEKLKDKFLSQTKLLLVEEDADLFLEGSIVAYTITPQAIQANETAAQNRLSISVNAKFTNLKDPKQNFETTFTQYTDYSSTSDINSIEETLIEEINDKLADDIFNKAVINW